MILRRHSAAGLRSFALYSECERYRYLLRRNWGPGGRLLYIMLNPSTATEARNDPTIERCERRARQAGFGGMDIANLFAWRATDPRELRRAPEPVGPDNDRILVRQAARAGLILCSWGVHGAHLGRDAAVLARLSGHRLWHLGLTKAGLPRHPLYVPYAQAPTRWQAD